MIALSSASRKEISAAWTNLECRAEVRKRRYGLGFAGIVLAATNGAVIVVVVLMAGS